jgi:hypothetical protein
LITLLFGGTAGDQAFEAYANSEHPYVRRFEALKDGELARFSGAVSESCNIIIKRNYHGIEVNRGRANDSMLIHVPEKDLVAAKESLDRIKSFIILAQDAGLETKTCSYKSELGDLLARSVW